MIDRVMGRGRLTEEEIRKLKANPYVEGINGSRIVYSRAFKLRFVREYFEGKRPTSIFEDAGFDVRTLGNKRIERCSARWREANASGSLGEVFPANDYYTKKENEKVLLKRLVREQQIEIDTLKKEIEDLKAELSIVQES